MIAHLINTDFGNRGITRLYLEYRRREFNFLKNAASTLLDNCERTLIITGFPIPPEMTPETDGPPGALALYRAVERLGGRAELLTYPEVETALASFGLRFAKSPQPEEYSLVIAVETPGKAADGKYHSMSGMEVTRRAFDWVVEEAGKLGIPTIGIGDGGNEVGMGKIRDLVRDCIPLGEKIGSVVETDDLVVSAVSNWGAYGLVAEASLLSDTSLLEGLDEGKILRAMLDAGVIDGVSKKLEPSVDGLPEEVHAGFFNMLLHAVALRKI